jgi:hypothetical protein
VTTKLPVAAGQDTVNAALQTKFRNDAPTSAELPPILKLPETGIARDGVASVRRPTSKAINNLNLLCRIDIVPSWDA